MENTNVSLSLHLWYMNVWTRMHTYGYIWIRMNTYGYVWIRMHSHGYIYRYAHAGIKRLSAFEELENTTTDQKDCIPSRYRRERQHAYI